jgi:serine/threonine-protein kinase RsbW
MGVHHEPRQTAGPREAQATEAVGAHLRVPATPAGARCLVQRVHAALTRAGWSGAPRADVMLAVDEAVQNAVEHGSQPEAPVEARIEVGPRRARVVIADRGRPGRDTPRGEPTAPAVSAVRGRGRVIMAALADRVTWRSRDGGTEVELIFGRDGADEAPRSSRRPDRRAERARG